MSFKTRIDRTGQRFGKLTAVKFHKINDNERAEWVFRCDCGNEKISDPLNLRRNPKISCGCTRKLPNNLAKKRRKYRNYKGSARAKDLEFKLTFDDFNSLITQKCHYCNTDPSVKFNGVDREDSAVGYILSNCLSCCERCNFAKGELSYDDFLGMIKAIFNNRLAK